MTRPQRAPLALAPLLMLALPALALPAGAQTAAQLSQEPSLVEELQILNSTLLEIKELLERQAETQGLDLMMKRMELYSSQVADLERRLKEAREGRRLVEAEVTQLEDRLQYMGMEVGESGLDEALYQTFERQAAVQGSRLRDRLAEIDNEAVLLENRLATKRRELEDWQAYVDRRLGGI